MDNWQALMDADIKSMRSGFPEYGKMVKPADKK